MNEGKRFERDVFDSHRSIFGKWSAVSVQYRLRDNPATYYGGTESGPLRFASDNICDFLWFRKPCWYLVECKSVAGKVASLSAMFGKFDAEKGRYHKQKHLDDMQHMAGCEGVHAVVMINYREVGKTYALTAEQCLDWLKNATDGGRKSIPESWCADNARQVAGRKLKTNWRWNIAALMDELEGENP